MESEEILLRDKEYVLGTYARFPVALVSGKNATCLDADGKSYIDMTSGIGVNSLGFCDEGWANAVYRQLLTLQHTSNLYYTEPCIDVAETLCRLTGMKKVFFCNSGAEANEGAIKAARKYSFTKYGPGRDRIVCLHNSFHGRTVTTLAATGQDVFHNYFFPFTEGFTFARPNDTQDTLSAMDETVCAVLLELVQGEGGVVPLEEGYVRAVADACAEKDILLLVDEVQTGAGRTGALYAFQRFGLLPDIVTSAKGLGGGLPFGAVLFGPKAQSALGPGDHASTFGANPAACAGALEVLRRLDDGFLAGVREKGERIARRMEKMPHVRGVTGMGLMLGAELDGVSAKDVVLKGIENGVLLLTAKTKVRLLPPLSITHAEIEQGLCAMEKALGSV